MNRKSHKRECGCPPHPKPMAMVGAGPLTSAIWKTGDEQGGWRYRFNLFRQLAPTGHVSQLFQPTDLTHLVKLTQVLAAVLADDGCLSAAERRLLRELATTLDEVTRRLTSATNRWIHTLRTVHHTHRGKADMATRPIHEIRKGLIKVRIWRKRTRSGLRHSVSIVRLFKNGDVWKESTRFSRDDIPLVRLVLDDAFAWIYEQRQKDAS